ncbi:MAG TPA: PhzF family phenazine biosynthesis protein [Candidatus Saccharimonadales bacterium]|nr:PhzF family phenazine biosynthesis protein [Candidatus Saccharimonadales bacterium]
MQNTQTPQSVPEHLVKANPKLWQVANEINWEELDPNLSIVVGSSFVDPADPFGLMGNPFAVAVGTNVAGLDANERLEIAKRTNTPETVFINSCEHNETNNYAINLTVYTPSGSEMGACAHGFLGAIQTLLQTGKISANSTLSIVTTLNTSANATIDELGNIALEFQAAAPQSLVVDGETLTNIYSISLGDYKNCGVLSVGSPKLTIEIAPEVFDSLQRNLGKIDYEALLKFQDSGKVNGIHIFCRNLQTMLPEKCIQNNAYSGPDNLADRATGVSNAAQISADENIKVGQSLKVTQYSFSGPSAILALTKLENGKIMVGGATALFNVE